MEKRRVPVNSVNTVNLVSEDDLDTKKKLTCRQRMCRYFIITLIIFIVLAFLAFILVFVAYPLVFKDSLELQRRVIFHVRNNTPTDPEFANFKKYGIEGVRNLYVTVNVEPSVSLGVWHILPDALVNDAKNNEHFDYNEALADGTYPAILYFHHTSGHRITAVDTYKVLRKFFHVIAFDYRSYGDSTEADLSEEAVVQDSVQLYKWLQVRTQAKGEIFMWGHSLGAALSTRTIAALHKLDVKPMGLFMEAPFTTMAEQFEQSTMAKVFSWLAWYKATITDPLYANGFRFESSTHILSTDCPVMIMHAEDDGFTPYSLGEKLSKIAQENRRNDQGSITFHSFPGRFGYDHWRIYQAPELPEYIKNHIDVCREYNIPKS